MKHRVYLETTVPSYLTAWPSRDLIVCSHQQLTREWWQTRRQDFELYVSPYVIDEVSAGDPEAARLRLEILRDIPLLDPSEAVIDLAEQLVKRIPIPPRAVPDALHIAIAAVHEIHFLLTWNCTHIANAEHRVTIETICREYGYHPPVICTPEELLKE